MDSVFVLGFNGQRVAIEISLEKALKFFIRLRAHTAGVHDRDHADFAGGSAVDCDGAVDFMHVEMTDGRCRPLLFESRGVLFEGYTGSQQDDCWKRIDDSGRPVHGPHCKSLRYCRYSVSLT